MDDRSHTIRQRWIDSLSNRGLSQTASILLEAFKPLSLLSAQLVFTGKPMLKLFMTEPSIDTAGALLEDQSEYQNFIEDLRAKA